MTFPCMSFITLVFLVFLLSGVRGVVRLTLYSSLMLASVAPARSHMDSKESISSFKSSDSRVLVRPPVYPVRPQYFEYHGDVRTDGYAYLRNRKDPVVKQLLKAENKACDALLAGPSSAAGAGGSLQRSLFQEIRSRWKEEEPSLPTLDRSFWYYTRQVKNAEHPLWCRRPYSVEDGVNEFFLEEVCAHLQTAPHEPLPFFEDEVIFLDLNLLAQELKLEFIELGDIDISPDESTMAVTVDCSNGKEIFTLFIIEIHNVNYLEWIRTGAGGAYRRWMQELQEANTSVYTPFSPSSLQATMSGRASRGSFSSNNGKRLQRKFPSRPSLTTLHHSLPASPTGAPKPRHAMQRRIDIFDMGSEVLWVGSHAVMYVAIDEKMRPFQVVYHDLALDEHDALASRVCYEEEEEAFWVGSLGFTADHRYLMFSSASTEVSEWYVAAVGHQVQRTGPMGVVRVNLQCIPIFYKELQRVESRSHSEAKAVMPFTRFSERSLVAAEYDLDHHDSLLGSLKYGGGGGAWVATANTMDALNFAVFIRQDSDWEAEIFAQEHTLLSQGTASLDNGRTIIDNTSSFVNLLEYDPDVRVEGVETYQHFLLISVRRGGVPTTLFCPQALVAAWWRTSSEAGVRSPLRYNQLLDLSTCIKEDLTAESVFDVRELVAMQGLRSGGQDSSIMYQSQAELGELLGWPPEGPQLKCSRLSFALESYPAQTSFDGLQWRLLVSHLLRPTVQYSCQYQPPSSPTDAQGAGVSSLGVLKIRLLKEEAVNGAEPYDPSAYDGMILWVPSDHSFSKPQPDCALLSTARPSERVHIPVTMCWRKSTMSLGHNAMMLHVYGGYGDSSDPDFSTERLSLLDRGLVWAYAAVRGGGELGIPWRDAGRKLQRATTVNDFISVSSYLQDIGICTPGRLISSGSSAGGMVVFRAMLHAPQLYFGVIGGVPFVDCLSSLLDDSLPLTVTERDEYGDPVSDPIAYHLLKSLSPTEMVPSGESVLYPNVMLQTSWGDTRVGYWEAMKLAAILRSRWSRSKAAGRHLVLCCDYGAGHGGSSGRYEQLKEIAREYTFALLMLQQQTR